MSVAHAVLLQGATREDALAVSGREAAVSGREAAVASVEVQPWVVPGPHATSDPVVLLPPPLQLTGTEARLASGSARAAVYVALCACGRVLLRVCVCKSVRVCVLCSAVCGMCVIQALGPTKKGKGACV